MDDEGEARGSVGGAGEEEMGDGLRDVAVGTMGEGRELEAI